MGLGDFEEICAVLESRTTERVMKGVYIEPARTVVPRHWYQISDPQLHLALSHGIYVLTYAPCSQFQSRGGLQTDSGLAAGDRTLGEAARLLGI